MPAYGFIDELTPENYSARVHPNRTHIAELGDRTTGILGLRIGHVIDVTSN